MELRQQFDINTTPKMQKTTDKQAHFKENDEIDLKHDKPFKDQFDEQIEQVKAQEETKKTDKNQDDARRSNESDQVNGERDSDTETNNIKADVAGDKEVETQEQQDSLSGRQTDDVTNPFIAVNLPETGSALPLSNINSTVPAPVSTVLQQAISAETSVKTSPTVPGTVSDVEMNSQRISDLINKTPLTSTNQNSDLINADVRTAKAVTVPSNLTSILSEKANIQDAKYSKVMGEMPTADVITQSTRMQQVPLTTAISASHVSVQNISNTLAVDSGNVLSSSTPLSNTLTTSIATNIQNPNWSQQMTQQVSYMIKGGFQQADIKLNPAHLGPMEIKLTMNDDNANISFVTQHAPVRDAIDAAMPRLKEMLEQQGLNLSDANVSTQSEQKQANTDSQQNSDVENGSDVVNDSAVSAEINQEIVVDMDVNSGVSIFA